MSGYPGGAYPGSQGGYRPGGTAPHPSQGGYPGAAPVSGGYPGTNSTQGGYQGGYPGSVPATGGYPGTSSAGGYPGSNSYQTRPSVPAPHGVGYPASAPPHGGHPTASSASYPNSSGGYGQPLAQVDPSVQQWFNAVDTDRSGQISADELRRALVNGNWSHFSEEACRMMIELYDKNGSGSIDINEFQQLFNSINQWRGIFQGYDTDKSGSINQSELTKAFQQMGYTFSPVFVQRLLTKYNMNTRQLSLDNFIVVSIQIRRLTEGFRHRDRSMQGQATIQYEDFIGLAMGVHQ